MKLSSFSTFEPVFSGHTSSWNAQAGFLTDCYNAEGENTHLPNLVDPTNVSDPKLLHEFEKHFQNRKKKFQEDNFKFLADFLDEVTTTFPEKLLHLGGDEVSDYITECW